MSYVIEHSDAKITVEEISGTRKLIKVELESDEVFMPLSTCETSYSHDLIEKILAVKGPEYLCDEINRDESPRYVEKHVNFDVFGYVAQEKFKGKKVLDFGCGSAASTMVLSRMLPDTHIVGVDLVEEFLDIAQLRAEHYNVGDRVEFLLSPNGSSLPEGVGDFDYIFLNAVYEHLLPEERDIVLPLLWSSLKTNGVLFLNQTPHRWTPVETHTTSGLPFINYIPDYFAGLYARHFSKRKLSDDDWATLLRKGIRGGSVSEVLGKLKNQPAGPLLLSPSNNGLKDRIDLWYEKSKGSRLIQLKKSLRSFFKIVYMSTGRVVLPTLSLAISKREQDLT